MRSVDLKGQRFGRLMVIAFAGRNKYRNAEWWCRCSCGEYMVVMGGSLANGSMMSCGCFKRECAKEIGKRNLVHGHSTKQRRVSSTYSTWARMLQRCENLNSVNFAYYGGKGITVCERWHFFKNFLADMGEKPVKGWHIHRIKSQEGYFPGNCEWISPGEHGPFKDKFKINMKEG